MCCNQHPRTPPKKEKEKKFFRIHLHFGIVFLGRGEARTRTKTQQRIFFLAGSWIWGCVCTVRIFHFAYMRVVHYMHSLPQQKRRTECWPCLSRLLKSTIRREWAVGGRAKKQIIKSSLYGEGGEAEELYRIEKGSRAIHRHRKCFAVVTVRIREEIVFFSCFLCILEEFGPESKF